MFPHSVVENIKSGFALWLLEFETVVSTRAPTIVRVSEPLLPLLLLRLLLVAVVAAAAGYVFAVVNAAERGGRV